MRMQLFVTHLRQLACDKNHGSSSFLSFPSLRSKSCGTTRRLSASQAAPPPDALDRPLSDWRGNRTSLTMSALSNLSARTSHSLRRVCLFVVFFGPASMTTARL